MEDVSQLLVFVLTAMVTLQARCDVLTDCAGKPADVVFVLDASNSIWQPDFQRQLTFVKDVVEFFTTGDRNMRVGVVTYADHPRLQFHLNYYQRKRDIKDAIDNVRQDGGYLTRTAEALRYVRERSFLDVYGARNGVARVAIVISDGRSENSTLTAEEASKIKAMGVHVFAIGVGANRDMEELKSIASEPEDFYTHVVENFQGLENIKDLLAIKTCAVTDPPTTTSTTTTTTTQRPTTSTSTSRPTTTRAPRTSQIRTTTFNRPLRSSAPTTKKKKVPTATLR